MGKFRWLNRERLLRPKWFVSCAFHNSSQFHRERGGGGLPVSCLRLRHRVEKAHLLIVRRGTVILCKWIVSPWRCSFSHGGCWEKCR